MSFDNETRNALSKMVASCRRLLMEDVTNQLQGRFGMHPDGTILSIDRLDLTEDEKAAAEALRELLDHFAAGEAGLADQRRRTSYDRLVLEISFTAVNRLAALRLCEERGLVVECVRQGTTSDGFRLFERISGGALGTRHHTYRVFLECLFDELALDLGILFDQSTPQSTVFPGERCLTNVLAELNKQELTHLWVADETIGWLYQYFNSDKDRERARYDDKGKPKAPQNSYELAVRNQFFTPRYVVEFLTDNTLGRIWYEMREGTTALKDECRYLVRHPTEVFLGPGEMAPPPEESETDRSPEDLIKQPVYIEHRRKKDPRDLQVIDPACGSGHFLLYASDVLERIYEEAWQDPESSKSEATGRSLREDYDSLDDLRRAAPKLIVEHNLHGIDIDPRAAQIAALALWLRAQKAWKKLGISGAERPRIDRSNIVTAEPMPGEEGMREEFTAGLNPRVLGQLVDVVFEKMKLAGEAGSLLRIEEEIRDTVAAARNQWLESPKPEQLLFVGMTKPQPTQQALRFDLQGVTDERFWERAEGQILETLKGYAERAENSGAVRRRLFVEDAARGFAFIDLCRKAYDVVLMNPPFGQSSAAAVRYVASAFPKSKHELALCASERANQLLADKGIVGAIITRTPFFLPTSHKWREDNLLGTVATLETMADFGVGVLDATVESVGFTARADHANKNSKPALFVRAVETDEKDRRLQEVVDALQEGLLPEGGYYVTLDRFYSIPLAPFSYWTPESIRRVFLRFGRFRNDQRDAKCGLGTLDDFRFLRLSWEPDPTQDDRSNPTWANYADGGSFTPFYESSSSVVNWRDGGRELKTFVAQRVGSASRKVQGASFYFRPGLTFPRRTKRFCPRPLPRGSIFSNAGQGVFLPTLDETVVALGLLSSDVCKYLISLSLGTNSQDQGGTNPQFEVGLIKRLPWPIDPESTGVGRIADACVLQKMTFESAFESSRLFRYPLLGPSQLGGIAEHAHRFAESARKLTTFLRRSVEQLNEAAFALYQIPIEDQRLFQAELGGNKDTDIRIPDESEFSCSLISWLVGCAFGRWDVRIALDPSLASVLPSPFDPLPFCPPGMLVGPDGRPAELGSIVSEEWLRTRPNVNDLPPEGSVENATIPDASYPLDVSWDGILVDDPGWDGGHLHKDDIIRRVREVLELLWKDKAHEIEHEACSTLGISDLRDYFRKPSGFYQDHQRRYSKKPRKAPVYWPLSTASGSYTLWVYYQRLTDQTVYTAVNKYVEPKIAEVERGITSIERTLESASGRDAARLRGGRDEGRTFLGELQELRQELLRVAALPYRPNLNDGVIINAAPFNKLFRLSAWARDTEKAWKKLQEGEYDWAHLAYTLWPERVREVCRRDRSMAIAHGLEDLCEVDPLTAKRGGKRKGRKEKEVRP